MADASKPSSNAAQIEDWNAAVGRTWTQFQEQLERHSIRSDGKRVRALAPMPGEHILTLDAVRRNDVGSRVRVGRLGSVRRP